MEQIENKIRQLEVFIRDTINDGKRCIDWEKLEVENISFRTKTQELFKFDKNDGWIFLITSLDSIGDSQMAIEYYLSEINCREIKFGEGYLKFYGVLNAIYIQQFAIISLGELFKINSIKIKEEFDKLKITFLRNAVGSHPNNFKIEKNITTYRINRSSLSYLNSFEIINHNNQLEVYNIFDEINNYQKSAFNILKLIAKKIITNRYKPNKDVKEKLFKDLEIIGK